jgi:hypothetical protein
MKPNRILRKLRPILALIVTAAAAALMGGLAAQPAHAATNPMPAHVFAPYQEAYSGDSPSQVASESGNKYIVMAFLQTATAGSCTAYWNGNTSMPISSSTFGSDIAAIQAAGGQVIPSFGGYTADTTGTDIADSCTNVASIAAVYESVITTYNVSRIDLDVEANSETDTAGLTRRAQAVAMTEAWAAANGRSVSFSYTIPTDATGPDSTGLSVMQNAIANGATVAIWNIMTFDYYIGTTQEMATDTETAANGLLSDLRSLYPNDSSTQLWGMIGLTDMIGIDDYGAAETFTEADASTVLNFAKSNGVGELSFWALERDNGGCPGTAGSDSCSGISQSTWFFSNAFEPFTSGTSTPPPTEGPYGGTPAAIPGTVQAANYDTGGQGVAYNVTSTNGTANSYRSDGVDLEACTDTGATGCGYDLGWTAAGQWFRYTVNVAAAGTYTVSLRLASLSGATDGLHIANSSGANLSGNINVPDTGAWQTWTTVAATVTLPAGQQTLTIDQDNGGWNIRYLTFATSTTSPGNTVTVTSPGNQTGTVGTAASLQVHGTDSASGQTLTYSATGLPAGLSISSSGLISGTPTTAGTSSVTVTAKDTTGASGSASFTWTIGSTTPPPGSLANGGFETGSLSPWVCQTGDAVVTSPVHSGSYAAQISPNNSQTGECDQTVTLSPNTTYKLTGWTQGNYAYIGVSGGATASTWTSSSGWTQQTVSFTTGSSGTVTVYIHGWYAQGNVYADDFSLS